MEADLQPERGCGTSPGEATGLQRNGLKSSSSHGN